MGHWTVKSSIKSVVLVAVYNNSAAYEIDWFDRSQQKHWLKPAGCLLQALVAARRQKPKKTKQRSDRERVKPSIVKGVVHRAAAVL